MLIYQRVTSSCSQGFVEEPRGAQDPRRHRRDGHQRAREPSSPWSPRLQTWTPTWVPWPPLAVGRLGWGNQGNWGKKRWKPGGKMRKMMENWGKTAKTMGKWRDMVEQWGFDLEIDGMNGVLQPQHQTVQPTVENLSLTVWPSKTYRDEVCGESK